MYKLITDVRPGETILEEGGGRTAVKQVDTETCKNKTHINEKDCYENFAEVRVQDS